MAFNNKHYLKDSDKIIYFEITKFYWILQQNDLCCTSDRVLIKDDLHIPAIPNSIQKPVSQFGDGNMRQHFYEFCDFQISYIHNS